MTSSADVAVIAKAQRARRLAELRARERLRPALELYDQRVATLNVAGDPEPLVTGLSWLTSIFRSSYAIVLKQIEDSGKTGIQAQNAIKRSAGTNFQGLCEYAISLWLENEGLPVAIAPNAPVALRDELTIHGIDNGSEFSVEPDIDICLWRPDDDPLSPIIFVSAKSSLVDRAGQAARWKMYLDLQQTTCTYIPLVPDCPVRRTKVKMKTRRKITHCIVTANIYKIDTTLPQGELSSGQCRNNTFMFEHRFSTRNDPAEVRPAGWNSFAEFPALVTAVFTSPPVAAATPLTIGP